jgi:hypothetical protein
MKSNEKLREKNRKCIEPAVGKKVYDYYNNALGVAEVNRFERHLIDCPYCEKVILELDLSLAVLSDEQDFDSIGKCGRQSKDSRPPPLARRRRN